MASAIQRIEARPALIEPVPTRAAPPQILRINRYTLRPETAVAMRNLQKQVALAMTRWENPQPCLAIESLTGPKEVWCLTGFQSAADQMRAAEKLEANEVLRSALDRIESQIRVLTGNSATVVANYLAGERRGRTWSMGRGHYLVITVSRSNPEMDGATYETADGLRYFITAARTRKDADARALAAGPQANVYAIRPTWGMPSRSWVIADPEFWNASPVAKQGPVPSSQFRTFTTGRW
jgi:hypothetical protein